MSVVAAALLASIASWLWFPSRADERLDDEPRDRIAPAVRDVLARLGPRGRRRAAQRRMRCIRCLAALAAELDAGQPPLTALVAADATGSVWPTSAAAARLGGDITEALHADAAEFPVLHQVAACWQVSTEVGGGLAASVSRLAVAARAAEDARVALEAELAGPRATARTLCLLPVGGLILGTLLGANPLGWLIGSGAGLACLFTGLLLVAAGAWWTARIAHRVERLL